MRTAPVHLSARRLHYFGAGEAALLLDVRTRSGYKMTEKTPPWWRSFVGKRRKAARESASILEQEFKAHTTDEKSKASHERPTEPEQTKTSTPRAQAEGDNSMLSDDRYDDSAVQPTFSENSNRRVLRVSRSGRFKEKRRERGALPQGYEDGEKSEPTKEASSPK